MQINILLYLRIRKNIDQMNVLENRNRINLKFYSGNNININQVE